MTKKYTEETCGACNGSGEGSYDGSTCYNCRGKGSEPVEVERSYSCMICGFTHHTIEDVAKCCCP